MSSGVSTFICPVADLDRARTVFGARFGLDPDGHARGVPGSVGDLAVDDIETGPRALLAAGAEVHGAIEDVGNGARIASVRDADGNVIGMIQDA